MTLTFKAVTWKNRDSAFEIGNTSLDLKTDSQGNYIVGPGQVLVKVHFAALNPVDLVLKNIATPGLFRAQKGIGFDYAGKVVAIGADAASAKNIQVGDEVCGINWKVLAAQGTVAQYTLVDATSSSGASIRKKPAKLSLEQAAAYPLVFGTAQSLFTAVPTNNTFRRILVIGAGTSVGRYAIQLAKFVYGSEQIVVTCSGKSREAITALGATDMIDYTQHKSILSPVLEVVKASGPFDAVLDCVGNSDVLAEASTIIKPRKEGGAFVTIVGDTKANYQHESIGALLRHYLLFFRLLRDYIGWLPYHYQWVMLNPLGDLWASQIAKVIDENDVVIDIDSVYPIEDIQTAVDRLRTNRAVGKVVIKIE